MQFSRRALIFLIVLSIGCLLSMPTRAQSSQNPGALPPVYTGRPSDIDEPGREKIEKEMAKKANKERQAKIKTDTDKLLKLATELKEYVDKSNENTLSFEVIKKADEIEKLAHDVREKMKGD